VKKASELRSTKKEKALKKTSGLLVLGKLSDFRLLRLYAFNILATCTVELRCSRVFDVNTLGQQLLA
jgi:hypothetical protein